MTRPYGVIYVATCRVNQKQYVGQTIVGVQARWAGHQVDAKRSTHAFGRAILKHGAGNFDLQVIDTASNQTDLDTKEVYWISHLDTRAPKGYNISIGGGGTGGVTPSSETKAKMRQAHLGKTMSAETREKMRAAKLGKPMPPEAVEKSRLGHLGKKMSDETKAKMSAASGGRRHTQETRDKISKALTGKKCSPEHVEKNRVAHLKENRSAEGIEKCRQAALNISPENREKLRQARLGKKQSPELVRKRMEGMARARALRAQKQILAPA